MKNDNSKEVEAIHNEILFNENEGTYVINIPNINEVVTFVFEGIIS